MTALRFPVVCFSQGLVELQETEAELTNCGKLALRKGGWFDGMIIVDSAGREFRVKSAKKLRGVGPLWGYRVFRSQRVQVQLDLESVREGVSAEEVKKRIRTSFRDWHGWKSRGDFGELTAALRMASSLDEVFGFLRHADETSRGDVE